jgi:hypothetical protein
MKKPFDWKPLSKIGAVLGATTVLTFLIVNRDWHRERAHEQALAGRGQYR